jgi:serine/threonine-protein kinase
VLQPGDVIDSKYRVVRRIGEGGMGAVYEGQNVRIGRRVAIKVMHAAMARHRLLVARFEREAQAAANIGSKHVVEVFDLGDLPDGERYMVMEYLEGESLAARLKSRTRLSPQEIAPLAVQLLDGLAKVHQAGIVHRDLKPPNIFLAQTEDGADLVKILDFGICKLADRKRAPGEISTGIGDLLGTLTYMSPEQLEHGSSGVDGRADLYAVGVMLYRAVTGALPYGASTVVDLLRELREGRAPRIVELADDVDERFASIVHKALEWDRTARFGTAREFKRALTDWSSNVARLSEVLSDFLDAPKPKESAPARSAGIQRMRRPASRPHEDVGPLDTTPAPEPATPVASKRSRRGGTVRMKAVRTEDAPNDAAVDIEIAIEIDTEPGGARGPR